MLEKNTTDIVIEVPSARLRLTSSAPTVVMLVRDQTEFMIETLRIIAKYMKGTTFAVKKEKDKDGKAAFNPVKPRRELRDSDLIAHANKKTVIACYPIAPGSNKTQCGLLDLDNHDKLSSWGQMTDAAKIIIAQLKKNQLVASLVTRSRGGAGIHIWVLFFKPLPAKGVRAYLTHVLEKCGFSDGEGGVANRQIEIFPKQNSVAADGYGNHNTLPFAGQSVVLDQGTFEEIWTKIEILVNAHGPIPEDEGSSNDDGFDAATLRSALKHISADEGRKTRIDVGLAIKNSAADANFDDQEAFQIWADWTDTSTERLDPRKRQDNWRGFKVRPKGDKDRLTLGTVYKKATANGWVRPLPTVDAKGRPIIRIYADSLSEPATRAQQLLLDAEVEFFGRSSRMVRYHLKEVSASHKRNTKVAQLEEVDATYMRDMLSRKICWQKWDGRAKAWSSIKPPMEVAQTVLGRKGEWLFPTIVGVISTPTMRPDGSLLLTPGYDPTTRLLLAAPPSLPAIPDHPTRDDALAALTLLEDLLIEFPFVDEVSKAVALSAMITPVARGAFPMTPTHVSRASIAGSGKSYLWDIVAAIAIGQLMPVMTAGKTEEETEKRLGAALIAGQPLISIDNVNGELKGDLICQAIERPIVQIRILGLSLNMDVEPRGLSMFVTGNNITIVGDLTRRVITTILDPKLERPELRKFEKRPVEIVFDDRGKYIAACLTICRAYSVAGRPDAVTPLASFEGWSDTVRSALMWLGKADPVLSMEATRAEDPDRGKLVDMLTAWANTIGIGRAYRCPAKKVIKLSEKIENFGNPSYPELHDAMLAVAAKKRGPISTGEIDTLAFAYWLRDNKGKIANLLRFANESTAGGKAFWWVEHLGGEKGEERYRVEQAERKAQQEAEDRNGDDEDDVKF
jgi:Primase C terminal 2 (PriCT-2)